MSSRKTATARANELPDYDRIQGRWLRGIPVLPHMPTGSMQARRPIWFQQYLRVARDVRIWKTIQSESLTANKSGGAFSLTVRTISRIIQRCQEAEKVQPVIHPHKNGVIAKSSRRRAAPSSGGV